MAFKDYYKILGFDSNKVSVAEIKVAYRDQAKKYHPDMNKGNEEYESIFKDINEAYKVLTNEKMRRNYDFSWNRHFIDNLRTEKKTFKEILLKMFFGIEYVDEPKKENSNINMVNGEDINVFIDIGIKKAFLGGRKSIQLGDEIVNFDIPAKIKNGEKIRIVGKGALGKNGGKPGDLVIIVNIKNSDTMQLINNDIYITFNLQAYDVALGTVINYRLFNEVLNIEIPECTSSGKKIVVKNKGYFIDDNNRGNLVIIVNVVFPKELSDDDKKLYLALRENNTYKND